MGKNTGFQRFFKANKRLKTHAGTSAPQSTITRNDSEKGGTVLTYILSFRFCLKFIFRILKLYMKLL